MSPTRDATLLALLALATVAPAAARAGSAAPPPSTLRAAMAACAARDDALQRLECYDRAARDLHVAPASRAPVPALAPAAPSRPAATAGGAAPGTGAWHVHLEKNERGRIVAGTLRLAADRQRGGVGDRARLVLTCRDGEAGAAIDWENYAGEEQVPVTLRLDGGAAARSTWPIAPNGSRTRYPGDAAKWIRTLLATRELTARLAPYGGYPVTAHFTLTGLAAAAAPLRRICGW